MVQFLIDLAHFIASLALSLVGISYDPASGSDEQDVVVQPIYAYFAMNEEAPEVLWTDESEIITYSFGETREWQTRVTRVKDIEFDIDLSDFLDFEAQPVSRTSRPSTVPVVRVDCPSSDEQAMSRVIVEDI